VGAIVFVVFGSGHLQSWARLTDIEKMGQSNLAKGDIARLLSISSVMSRRVMADILDSVELELAPFDPPTPITLP